MKRSWLRIQGVPRNMTVGELFWMSSSLLPHTLLDSKDFFKFKLFLLKKCLTYMNFNVKSILLVSSVSNILSNYGRRHFKLFTNCHVSWDTLYLILNFLARFLAAFLKRKSSFSNLLSIYVECKKVWLSLFCLDFFNNFRISTKSFCI